MSRKRYIVAYDITDQKRLRRTYKTMLDFGDHLQYSVFLCELNKSELIALKENLGKIINNHEDQVIFTNLGPADNRNQWPKHISAMGKPFIPPERVRII